ncbi:MAG: antitoxin family protein [Anaerolineae bacterium]
MGKTIEALYDGLVLRPVEPLALEPNTRVWIVIEIVPPTTDTPRSFLRTARSLNLDGPSDWSANLENYLYGDKAQ